MLESSNHATEWLAANQRFVVASLALLRALLERQSADALQAARADVDAADASMPAPAALVRLGALFGLSAFERQLLMLCAGVELDGNFAQACAKAQNDSESWLPTFGLALAVLPNAHWSAIAPASPLRRYCLIDVLPGHGLSSSPLRIHERVLHYLAGLDQPEEALAGILSPVALPIGSNAVQDDLAAKIVNECEDVDSAHEWPVIELIGPVRGEKIAIAAMAIARLGLNLHRLDASTVNANRDEHRWMYLIGREMMLTRGVLLLDCDDLDESEDNMAQRVSARRFAEQFPGPLFVLGKTSLRIAQRRCFSLIVERTVERADAATDLLEWAEHVETYHTWDDLVASEGLRQALQQIVVHVKQRDFLHNEWGFTDTATLGVHVLFTGASGTGKTMAAGCLARELGVKLYRVELSRIMSKYIGDTEKNLRQLFAAAEETRCILLFDEADALFGARSHVKGSHDRYANLEIAYLLQRMESHRGLSILTTNMRDALEPAFLRRLRFVVEFPFPTTTERAQIWRRVFPEATPTQDLDFDRLAQLNIAGGNIRNIAIAAASLAAAQDKPVMMEHVNLGVVAEYKKRTT